MASDEYAAGISDPMPASPAVTPAGAREQIDIAIMRDMFREPTDVPRDLHYLLSGTQDVYSQRGDRMPGIYQILSYSHVPSFRHKLHVRKHKHSDLMAAQFYDIDRDGGEIA